MPEISDTSWCPVDERAPAQVQRARVLREVHFRVMRSLHVTFSRSRALVHARRIRTRIPRRLPPRLVRTSSSRRGSRPTRDTRRCRPRPRASQPRARHSAAVCSIAAATRRRGVPSARAARSERCAASGRRCFGAFDSFAWLSDAPGRSPASPNDRPADHVIRHTFAHAPHERAASIEPRDGEVAEEQCEDRSVRYGSPSRARHARPTPARRVRAAHALAVQGNARAAWARQTDSGRAACDVVGGPRRQDGLRTVARVGSSRCTFDVYDARRGPRVVAGQTGNGDRDAR